MQDAAFAERILFFVGEPEMLAQAYRQMRDALDMALGVEVLASMARAIENSTASALSNCSFRYFT